MPPENDNDFERTREQDFASGAWLQEIEAEYAKYLDATKSPLRYWEEAFAALKYLWDKKQLAVFLQQVEEHWRGGYLDHYTYIKISNPVSYPQGVMFHVQYNCPASTYFMPNTREQAALANKRIDFSAPNKQFLQPLLAAIKSMHLDLYDAFRTAKNLQIPARMHSIFHAPRYGCLNEKVRMFQDAHKKMTDDLPWEQLVEMILSDYTKFVCNAKGWNLMNYQALATKDQGVHFYLEDIVAFAEKFHASIKGYDKHDKITKIVDDLKDTLEQWGIADSRPLTQEQQKKLEADRQAREIDYNSPIGQELMQDPVATNCGHSFEKTELEQWFAKQQEKANRLEGAERENAKVNTCPLCTKPALPLKANDGLRREIQAFKEGGHEAAEKERAKVQAENRRKKAIAPPNAPLMFSTAATTPAAAVNQIPAAVITPAFVGFTGAQLADIFNAIPPHVTTINLGNININNTGTLIINHNINIITFNGNLTNNHTLTINNNLFNNNITINTNTFTW